MFSLADRVGVALERCPGLPSSWRLARTEGIWAVARAAATNQEDATNHAARVHGRRRLHRSPAGGVAACEQLPFSRERSWHRRASEAGARASLSREACPSTRVVGAGRARPIRSASDAVGEQPGLESGGSHRVTPARLITDARCERGLRAVRFGSAGFTSFDCCRSLEDYVYTKTSFLLPLVFCEYKMNFLGSSTVHDVLAQIHFLFLPCGCSSVS